DPQQAEGLALVLCEGGSSVTKLALTLPEDERPQRVQQLKRTLQFIYSSSLEAFARQPGGGGGAGCAGFGVGRPCGVFFCPLRRHGGFCRSASFATSPLGDSSMSHNKSKMALAVGLGIWGMQAQAFEIDTGPHFTTSLESVAEFTSVYRTSSPERIE